METINTETLITSLFRVGFDRVDGLLFTYTLGAMRQDEDGRKNFHFDDRKTSDWFNQYVELKDGVFSLKEGYSLDTLVEASSNVKVPLRYLIQTNRKLTEYLSTFDFSRVISKKLLVLGANSVEEYPNSYSEREKQAINGKAVTLTHKQSGNRN